MNIGLSQRILHYNNVAYECLEHGWYNLLSGHTFFYITNIIEQDSKKLVRDLYLVILTGGDESHKRIVCKKKDLTKR